LPEFLSQDRNEAEEAKEKSSGLFDPTAEAFTRSFTVTISLLVTAIVAGLIWHFARYRRKTRKEKKQLEELSKFLCLIVSL
jgi:flagellar biosynthesis/type III secretory pathway M-ring protein FliF/YscJ